MHWFNDHMTPNVSVKECGDEVSGFSLSGPASRSVMKPLNTEIATLSFLGCDAFDIDLLRTKVGRLSVTGELGYEIHCRAGDHANLRHTLLKSGADDNMTEFGFNGLLSLRLEKAMRR